MRRRADIDTGRCGAESRAGFWTECSGLRLRQSVDRGAAAGCDRRALPFRAAPLSRAPGRYRHETELTVMSMRSAPRQLALALDHSESFAREDFLPGPSNAAALALVESWPDWPDRIVVLAGPEGSGKSHLAAIWAGEAGARFLSARSLAGADLPAALATGALVVEDVAAGICDERALFHLLNLAREQGAYLLLTGRTPPSGWMVRLRDLGSR